jgi:hypothetical protein
LFKTIALTAVAAFAVATSAGASEIRVATAGKSVSQLNSEVAQAAHVVCKRDTAADPLSMQARKACYRVSLQAARQQVEQFAAADGRQLAQR